MLNDGRPVAGVLELEPEIVVCNFTRVFGEVDDMGDDAGAIASETFSLGGILRGAVPEREAPEAEEERARNDEEHPPPSRAALTDTEPDAEPEQPNATKHRQLGTEKTFRSHVSCGGPWHFTQFHRLYSTYLLHIPMIIPDALHLVTHRARPGRSGQETASRERGTSARWRRWGSARLP